MLDQQDLKWIAATSTELNSILQQIQRYQDLARRHQGQQHYVELMGERVELASKTAQALFDKVTTNILTSVTNTAKAARLAPGQFTVLPSPVKSASPSGTTVSKTPDAAGPDHDNKRVKAGNITDQVPKDIVVKNPRGERELILLVDDEAEVAELAAEMLAMEGYKVIVSHDGFEALKIYERIGAHIGLVILDFFLPVMDGDAVFDELRGLNPNINVVLSSGFAEEQKISAMLAQGLRGFIPKPYSREKLLRQVRSTLDAGKQNGGR